MSLFLDTSSEEKVRHKLENYATSRPLVVVTMATGLQGNGVVKHLSNTGLFRIRAITRDPFSKKSLELLRYQNVEIVKADLLDVESLNDVFTDAYAVFGNTTPTKNWKLFEGSMSHDYEMMQGENLIKAVAKARNDGVLKHFVFSSVCKSKISKNSESTPRHFLNKWEIEELISLSSLDDVSTVLRPASYFENFLSKLPGVSISKRGFRGVVLPNAQWQTLAVDDVGAWTRAALMNPKRFLGFKLNIAGEELTGNQMAETLQSLRPKDVNKVNYKMIPRSIMRILEHDIATMASWIESSGYGADLSYLSKLSSEFKVKITSLSQWLKLKKLV